MNEAIITKVHSRIQWVFEKLLGYVPTYTIHFTNLGRTAGKAHRSSRTMWFDEKLLNDNTEHFIQQTVSHEVCHLIQWIKYPNAKQAHGPEFRKLMSIIGCDETTYHSYDVSHVITKRNMREFRYECSCCGKFFDLSSRMHNSITLGRHKTHTQCNTRITFVSEV